MGLDRSGPGFDGGVRVESALQVYRPLLIGSAAVAPLLVCVVLAAFRDGVENTNAALVLVLVIVAAASTGIRTAGLVAAVSSAAWFDFFLTEPYNSFSIDDRVDVETAVLLVVVGAAVTEIALWGRRQQARASQEQGYLDGVVGTAATVAAGVVSTDSLIDGVCTQIVDVLHVDDCRFDTGVAGDLPTIEADGTLTHHGHSINVDRSGLPTNSEIELRVRSGGTVRGRFLITAATRVARPSPAELRVAVALADQVGAALATNKTA